MARTASAELIVIKKRERKALLREIISEVMRDELRHLAAHPEDWQFDPESPPYQAMLEIRQDVQAGRVRLLTHKEVFGE